MVDKFSSQPTIPEQTERLLRLATYASISVAIVLIVAKLIAWGLSDSVSLLATLIDSVLDAFASLINLIAVRHALTPADKEHRFGHGKAEALAGLSQSMFITGSAGFLLLEVGRRVINPIPIQYAGLSIAVMIFSILVTLLLLGFQNHVVRKTQSTAIQADALHYKSDLLMNGGVIIALWLSTRGWPQFDAPIAGLIAIYILYSVWGIVRVSLDQLMDRELPDEVREDIQRIVLQHPCAQGMHDLRSRHSGTVTFIQLHLELDDDLSLIEAHNVSDEVEEALLQAFPGSEIIIHMDPKSVVGHEAADEFN